jgi:hypothetical protein
MTELERVPGTPLKNAPGEPSTTLVPPAVQSASRPRRLLAPILAAAAVVTVAVPTAVLIDRGSSPEPPGDRTARPVHRQPGDPRQAADRAAARMIATAPVPPGAHELSAAPLRALAEPPSVPGAQHVQRTRFWTAPGTVTAAISYLEEHQPEGMHSSGSGRFGGPGIPTTRTVEFQGDQLRSLQYSVVSYRGGVAIRADAQVLWAPRRDPADTVPASVTSVDVLVVRQNPQAHRGAPTVRRTLTGARARALAEFVNRLPRAIPLGAVSCPAGLVGEHWLDRLRFHTAGATAELVVDLSACPRAAFQAGRRAAIQLSGPTDIDHVIMKAVGLSANYGG